MTPFTDLLVVGGTGAVGLRARKMPVAPAGRILPPDGFRPTDEVRLLYAGVDPIFGAIRWELSRRVRIGGWPKDGVQMPDGPVVAAVWRAEDQRYVALSHPFDLVAGKSARVTSSAPQPEAGHLIVYVQRAAGTKPAQAEGLSLRVEYPERSVEPDLTVATIWGAYAFWYDLPEGLGEVVGESGQLTVAATEIVVERGAVVRASAELERPGSKAGSNGS